MKKVFAFILIAIFGGLSFGSQQQGRKSLSLDNDDVSPLAKSTPTTRLIDATWSEFSPPNGDFSVMMPGWPESATQKAPYSGGDLTLYGFHVGLIDRAFTVTYVDYPGIIESKIDEAFDAGRDRLVSESRAKLVSEKKLKLKNYPGREWGFVLDQKLTYVRSYLVGNRLYAMYAEEDNDKGQSDETKRFFSSFKVIEK